MIVTESIVEQLLDGWLLRLVVYVMRRPNRSNRKSTAMGASGLIALAALNWSQRAGLRRRPQKLQVELRSRMCGPPLTHGIQRSPNAII